MTEPEIRESLCRAALQYESAMAAYDQSIQDPTVDSRDRDMIQRRLERGRRDIEVSARQLVEAIVGPRLEVTLKIEKVGMR